MNPLTLEWLAKAEGDFAMAERESRAGEDAFHDGICFHAQQCAEKYLKARLCESGVPFTKTHDLVILLELALPVEPGWQTYREDMAFLSSFAMAFRYPGDSADEGCAADALRLCRRLREAARHAMGLA